MTDHQQHERIFQAPTVVMAVLGILVAIHTLRVFGGSDIDEWMILHLAMFPGRFTETSVLFPGPDWLAYSTLFTHALLHGDWMHLAFNGAWFLAFGSMIARRTGVLGFLALFAVCALAGGVAFLLANHGSMAQVVGASGAISGLMGASFRVLFSAMDWGGITTLQHIPKLIPRMPLIVALQDRRVVMSVLLWVAINLVFGLLVPGVLTTAGIAWEAHLGGFAAGFLLFDWFDRGRGWTTEIPAGSHQRSD
jgi:membrane associated rhomboid family serine protease